MHLTSKGQVTIPKNLREKYGLQEGSDVGFVEEKGALKLIKLTKKNTPFDKVYGILKMKRSTDDVMKELRGA